MRIPITAATPPVSLFESPKLNTTTSSPSLFLAFVSPAPTALLAAAEATATGRTTLLVVPAAAAAGPGM
uniref:Uncharacterized protein n=1 Tax=Arundo donax TaxID=35708 RepID=A0A0A9D8K4_ARUDO